MRSAGIEVTTGVLEEEALALNEVFIKYITTSRPFVVAKAAVSLDGKIATRTGKSKWITGEEARAYGGQLSWYDAIMVGIGTVLADDPALTTRLPDGGGRDPVRIILDSKARIPERQGVDPGNRQHPQ
ncbi:MAG: dihydrofolate reductase family protein [Candidatus Syntrophopropionicum ammoniitolerans]